MSRDIFEVANQLAGYVGPSTPEPLAAFLLREAKEAEKLACEIDRLRGILHNAVPSYSEAVMIAKFAPGDRVVAGDDIEAVVKEVQFHREMRGPLYVVEWWHAGEMRSQRLHEADLTPSTKGGSGDG